MITISQSPDVRQLCRTKGTTREIVRRKKYQCAEDNEWLRRSGSFFSRRRGDHNRRILLTMKRDSAERGGVIRRIDEYFLFTKKKKDSAAKREAVGKTKRYATRRDTPKVESWERERQDFPEESSGGAEGTRIYRLPSPVSRASNRTRKTKRDVRVLEAPTESHFSRANPSTIQAELSRDCRAESLIFRPFPKKGDDVSRLRFGDLPENCRNDDGFSLRDDRIYLTIII